jgi:hypothetical protein
MIPAPSGVFGKKKARSVERALAGTGKIPQRPLYCGLIIRMRRAGFRNCMDIK